MRSPKLRKYWGAVCLLAAACFCLAPRGFADKAPESPVSVAFVHANVISMTKEGVDKDQTVIVTNGKIVEVGPATKVKVPAGATKIDARNKYLIPGLTDAHVHLQTTVEFPLYIVNGVTTVYNLDGTPAHILWREEIAKGKLRGPTIFTTGPIFFGPHKPETSVKMVDEQAKLGYDGVKIYNGVSKEEFPFLIAEAKKNHMLLMGHVSRGTDFEATVAAGQSIAHLEEYTYTFFNPMHDDNNKHIVYDDSKIPEAVRLTVKSGVYVTPTLSTYATIVQQATALDEFLKNADLRYDAPWIRASLQPETNRYANRFNELSDQAQLRRSLEFQRKLVKALEDAGVPLLCGTDASDVGPVAGFGIHVELRELVSDGLTPYQALQTATVNPARYFGRSADFGTIEAGKRADLVLLKGNPLQDIGQTRSIAGVMTRGHWEERKELDQSVQRVPEDYTREIAKWKSMLETNPEQAAKLGNEQDPFHNFGASALREIVLRDGFEKFRESAHKLRGEQGMAPLVSEQAINALGYALLTEKNNKEAVEVLRMNVQDFPQSSNAWDSLGEAQFRSGDVAHAVENYQKALDVEPNYANATVARRFIADHATANK
jgi:imidazolonepropionase-like amidohydrolase